MRHAKRFVIPALEKGKLDMIVCHDEKVQYYWACGLNIKGKGSFGPSKALFAIVRSSP